MFKFNDANNILARWKPRRTGSIPDWIVLISHGFLSSTKIITKLNTYHAAGVSRRQVKNVIKYSKLSKLLNFITIFVITMENVFK